jgi:alpha-ketoglutarate-dependent taurine dioxygenase
MMRKQKLNHEVGALCSGIEPHTVQNDSEINQIYQALCQHGRLVFPAQELDGTLLTVSYRSCARFGRHTGW